MQLKKDGETFATLTVKELQIFTILFKNFNQYVSRKKIFEEAWKGTNVSTKTLDVHLFNLRKKIINSGLRIRFELPDSFVLYSDPREAN